VLELVRLERLLDPGQAVLLEGVRQADREARVPGEGVDSAVPQGHRPRPDALAEQPDELDIALDLAPDPCVALLPEAELAAAVAQLGDVVRAPVGLHLEARSCGVGGCPRP